MPKTGAVQTEGANIVYDVEGTGPLLLTITGAGGAAATYAPVARACRCISAANVIRPTAAAPELLDNRGAGGGAGPVRRC